jgi:hypothetical protein
MAPTTAALVEPTASITVTMSSAQVSSEANESEGTWSEEPDPLLSKRMSREKELNRSRNRLNSGCSQMRSMGDAQFGT